MRSSFRAQSVSLLAAVGLSGCGLYSPSMEVGDDYNLTAYLAAKIVGHVKCELGRAILSERKYDIDYARENKLARQIKWLDTSAGTLTITMQVDEKSAVNPGLSWTDPLSKVENFNLGVGGSALAEATRKQQTDYVFDVKKDFIDQKDKRLYDPDNSIAKCEDDGGLQIEGDLKIKEWLHSSLFPFDIPKDVDQREPDVLTDDVTFIVSISANATPGAKLVRITVNPSGPFASATRTRTNEALISLGPAAKAGTGKAQGGSGPSQAVLDFRNISLIGSALNISVKTP